MANTDVIDVIISMVQQYFVYMLPVIGVLSGIIFIVSMLFSVTLGMGRRVIK